MVGWKVSGIAIEAPKLSSKRDGERSVEGESGDDGRRGGTCVGGYVGKKSRGEEASYVLGFSWRAEGASSNGRRISRPVFHGIFYVKG